MRTEHIHVSRIEPHPGNILGDLAELAGSIRAHGLLQPLIVTPHPQIPGRYQLLAGHRRLAAAKTGCPAWSAATPARATPRRSR